MICSPSVRLRSEKVMAGIIRSLLPGRGKPRGSIGRSLHPLGVFPSVSPKAGRMPPGPKPVRRSVPTVADPKAGVLSPEGENPPRRVASGTGRLGQPEGVPGGSAPEGPHPVPPRFPAAARGQRRSGDPGPSSEIATSFSRLVPMFREPRRSSIGTPLRPLLPHRATIRGGEVVGTRVNPERVSAEAATPSGFESEHTHGSATAQIRSVDRFRALFPNFATLVPG